MAEKMNIVEKANKVLSFRKIIRDLCRKKGIEYPSDDKIAEYITSGYGMNVEDFMADYTEKEGIFREPIADFAAKVWEYAWSEQNKPTMAEMTEWVTKNGYDVEGFLRDKTIKSYEPLVRETLISALSLSDKKLVELWNKFIEESALYGEDSYIYDLTNESDLKFLHSRMKPSEFVEICRLAKNNNTKYVQWFALNDGEISAKTDIKGIIIAYWGEIFERVMLYPYAYQFNAEKYAEGDGSTFFDDVFFPILAEKLGYHIDGDKGTITKIEKN